MTTATPGTPTADKTAFPIDLGEYKKVAIDPWKTPELSKEQLADLQSNIEFCRDLIVFFTATGAARGLAGHTGGPFDVVPEVVIMDAMFRGAPDRFVPIFFDEAGHRVAIQYMMAALHGELEPMRLTKYREGHSHLPGHPERHYTPGVKIASGRLGHMWPYVNGVAMANPGKVVFCLGSDGSQQEGNDAEAARLAVAKGLNVKVLIDDNDVTIAGFPSKYLPGYDVGATMAGHGLRVLSGNGEELAKLYTRMQQAVTCDGPVAVVNKRKMAPGVPGLEGSNHAHDVFKVDVATKWLESRGRPEAAEFLKAITKTKHDYKYLGSGDKIGSMRKTFGTAFNSVLDQMSEADRKAKVMVIDSDLEGSTGLDAIHKAHPEVYVTSGVMERGNFSAAAGFGYDEGKQGVFSTFAAFQEMVLSEITMARLNYSNVLCHFSHSGIDWMADNTCHFGLNNMFADNGLDEGGSETRLYMPADAGQMHAMVRRVFGDKGLRFVYSVRSETPNILTADGKDMYGEGYKFEPGKDELIREGTAGYIVSFGDALYRALDAVERLKKDGVDIGLINKPTLNVIDEAMMKRVGKSPLVLVVECFSERTGLGSKFGSWLLRRGLTPRFDHIGTHREGSGGMWEHYPHQGLDPASIIKKVKAMAG